jgi:2-methylcitrate dehydratase
MNGKAPDRTQTRLAQYAHDLRYEFLPPEVTWKAKAHVIDTLGALLAGFASEAARMARDLAAQRSVPRGVTVIGSGIMTTLDMATFANAIAVRGVDTLDAYHRHGKVGHPADVVAPLLAAAEHAQASGRELIAAIVVAYELFCWLRDDFEDEGFDNTNCARLAAAAGAGKLLRLDPSGIAECLALAAVSDNALKEVRSRPAAMTRNTASGWGARAAVFAALLAAAGGRGPRQPFEGETGWLRQVAAGCYNLDNLGGAGAPYRLLDTWIKLRAIPGVAYPVVLAAEKLAPLGDPADVDRITLEVYGKLKKGFGEGEKRWNPDSSDTADHSAPYILATILINGGLTLRSFDSDHIRDSRTRALMQKVEVLEDEEFSAAYKQRHEHRARITLIKANGERLVAETGGDEDDLSAPRNELQVNDKFQTLAGEALGADRARSALSRWWKLEDARNVAELIPALRLDLPAS